MDVRCGRCGTEYEFDDALVSERGTTVKCTNCGHQFKVHPPESSGASPERWVVRTMSGRELVYTSLRELQRGIAQRQVGPEDLLSRGQGPPRPLGAIAELEPFFQGRAGASLRAPHQPRTLAGVAPPPAGSYAGPNPAGPHAPVNRTPAMPFTVRIEDEPTRPMNESQAIALRTLSEQASAASANAPESRVDPLGSTRPNMEGDPPTLPRNSPPALGTPLPGPLPPPPIPPRPNAMAVRDRMNSNPGLTPTPADVAEGYRPHQESIPDSRYVPHSQTRGVRTRWIAGIVLLGVTLLVIGTVGRRYLEKYRGTAASAQVSSDARVAEFLAAADKKLEDGDFEGAREQLDKASVLAERDPGVLAALAHLEAMRADSLWLRLRLLDPKNGSVVQSTHKQLGARVGRAKEALARAVEVAPDAAAVVRARVDILRLAGELAEARKHVAPLSASASPEDAYVLAALDLAEPQPAWASVIDRLRTATGSERGLGRARAALVYALVRSGQVSVAKTELAKISERAEGDPLYADLDAFVGRHADALADAGTDAQAEVATVDPSSLPILDTSGGNEPIPGDFRGQLKSAASALKSGQLDRADQLYKAVLAKEPGNTEAMAGLAEVAKQKKDPEAAAKMYEKVLKQNPSYLPALIGAADQKWDSGDRKGALVLYRRVLEQAGAGSSYGQRAASRISEGEGGATPPTTAKPKEPKEPVVEPKEPPVEPKEPPKEDPHIDTTDLPEFNK
jgi:predicted Zn finger-like uncharacterized protein